MALQQDRTEVLELIGQIKNANLMADLKEVLKDLLSPRDFQLSTGQKEILDARIEKYKAGEGQLFTWQEVVDSVKSK